MRNRPAGFGLFPLDRCISAREEETENKNINMMDGTIEILKGTVR